ncbi:MAG: recombination protein RecR [Planctomycetes bacterium]|nr:recombination protein RecR [Planctomycetota bacterium]
MASGRSSSSSSTQGSGAHPEPVQRLVEAFAQLPGIGRRTAERLAFHVLKSPKAEAQRLAQAIDQVKSQVRHCGICFNVTDTDPCPICTDGRRDAAVVMVVEQPKDLWILERTGAHRGVYHCLMGRLEPLDGVGPETLTVRELLQRVEHPERNAGGVKVTEVILATNPDLEGDSTGLYLADRLSKLGVMVSRLARGLPAGSQIEFAHRGALADAIAGRRKLS